MKVRNSFLLKIAITCIPIICNIISGILIFSFIIIDAQNNIDENVMRTLVNKSLTAEEKLNKSIRTMQYGKNLRNHVAEIKFSRFADSCLSYNMVSSHEFALTCPPKKKQFCEWLVENQKQCFVIANEEETKTVCEDIEAIYPIIIAQVAFIKAECDSIEAFWKSTINKKMESEMISYEKTQAYHDSLLMFNEKIIIPMRNTLAQIPTTLQNNHIQTVNTIDSWRLSISVNYGIIITISIIFSVSEICYLLFVLKKKK
ncbi:unnamed protein product [Caenorhabditis angaria]|uniref:Uncharacterized protein n=1 Tax=Caenorhabditis angaria TaxID=860376 RepID=A0A9P1IHP8_9PELO|nr:unnamed protein product [Caenorhabditis angaria]